MENFAAREGISAGERFLLSSHDQLPGKTPSFFSFPLDSSLPHRTSYDTLVELVRPGAGGAAVLDLACGDGEVSERLLKKFGSSVRLTALDMSPGELTLAEKRLARFGPGAVDLRLGRAQQLPLKDGSVDYVLCHMALMLMDPVCDVLAEVSRVLKPGGLFAAVVGAGWERGPVLAAYQGIYRRKAEQWGCGPMPPLGDARIRDPERLRELFGPETNGLLPPEVEELSLGLELSAGGLAEFFATCYNSLFLPEEARQELFWELRQFYQAMETESGIPYRAYLRRIVSRKV
jgi:ubiquinone/menaquinone biosynthesis C-methylase UbiE